MATSLIMQMCSLQKTPICNCVSMWKHINSCNYPWETYLQTACTPGIIQAKSVSIFGCCPSYILENNAVFSLNTHRNQIKVTLFT